MTKSENNCNDNARSRTISRRDFLKLAAAAGLLAGCRATQQQDATPVSTPTRTPASTPTATPIPNVVIRRPEIIKTYPDVPSKVVYTHHAGVWEGDDLVPEILRDMLDAAISELTGLEDAVEAWAALFSPDERIAIKVNTIATLAPTHVPLVMAVTERLQAVGVPAEQIVIFDRFTQELENKGGYPVNRDGPGVRCYGTVLDYTPGWALLGQDIQFSNILLACDALINIPILKQAGGPGISFAMKNHYGTFDKPTHFHAPEFVRAIGELNALPPIRERTRLIIGDVLTDGKVYDTRFYAIGTAGAILMSFDPVAHDTVGLQLVNQVLTAEGSSTKATTSQATPWLEHAAKIGLGTNDPDNMDVVEIELG